jgi:hypothetical protein
MKGRTAKLILLFKPEFNALQTAFLQIYRQYIFSFAVSAKEEILIPLPEDGGAYADYCCAFGYCGFIIAAHPHGEFGEFCGKG